MDGEPNGFFSTTPRLLGLVLEGRTRARRHDFKMKAWLAHTVASLERSAKIPALDKIIGGKDITSRRSRPATAGELLSCVRRWHGALPSGGDPDAR